MAFSKLGEFAGTLVGSAVNAYNKAKNKDTTKKTTTNNNTSNKGANTNNTSNKSVNAYSNEVKPAERKKFIAIGGEARRGTVSTKPEKSGHPAYTLSKKDNEFLTSMNSKRSSTPEPKKEKKTDSNTNAKKTTTPKYTYNNKTHLVTESYTNANGVKDNRYKIGKNGIYRTISPEAAGEIRGKKAKAAIDKHYDAKKKPIAEKLAKKGITDLKPYEDKKKKRT